MQKGSRYTEAEAARLMFKMVAAIGYCHYMGISHRDLKLENFIFESKDVDSNIKLIDFGLSAKYGSSIRRMHTMVRALLHVLLRGAGCCGGWLLWLGVVFAACAAFYHPRGLAPFSALCLQVGTAYYIAPEVLNQAEGGTFGSFGATSGYTQACDLWSLGVIAYMLVRATSIVAVVAIGCAVLRIFHLCVDLLTASAVSAYCPRSLQLSGTPPFKGRRDREVLAAVRKGELNAGLLAPPVPSARRIAALAWRLTTTHFFRNAFRPAPRSTTRVSLPPLRFLALQASTPSPARAGS